MNKPLAPTLTFLRRHQRAGLLVLVISGLAAAVLAWPGRKEPAAPRYTTAVATRATLSDEISALGTLQPVQAVDVGTQVTGLLRRVHVQIGQTVTAQQLLAELDPTLLDARVQASRAGLRQLRAQLLDRSAQAELAGQQQRRNQRLIQAEAVSEELLQASAAAAQSARAQVDALRAQIEQAEANLVADEASLRYTRIHAPIEGTVVTLNAREGQTLVASQQAPVILRIANLARMTVWAQVSEADVPHIRAGMPASFNTLGLPQRRWQGLVRQVLPTPESLNNVVLYQVLFEVDNADGVLRPQMSAQVSFVRARADNALVVPSAALTAAAQVRDDTMAGQKKSGPSASKRAREGLNPVAYVAGSGGGVDNPGHPGTTGQPEAITQVQVLHADGRLELRPVRVGIRTRNSVQVLAGLAEGESVITGQDRESGATKAKGAGKTASLGKLF